MVRLAGWQVLPSANELPGHFTELHSTHTALPDYADASITNPSFLHCTAVGQFKDLVESAEKDAPLQDALKKALNFTGKGWDAARAHVLRAVHTDNRMRIWLADDAGDSGLLFRCNLGRADLDAPLGVRCGVSLAP